MRRLIVVAALLLAAFAPAGQSGPRAEAYFAMGCFWCAEADMEKVPGVIAAVSGYTGGNTKNPTYEEVSAGGTGHYEAVRVTYDPRKVSYATLLKIFWKNIDPFDPAGQFCDKGDSYRAAIFPVNAEQRQLAAKTKAETEARLGKPVAVRIVSKTPFTAAEDYHQNYAKKNPIRYRFYRGGCGRDARLKEVWGG